MMRFNFDFFLKSLRTVSSKGTENILLIRAPLECSELHNVHILLGGGGECIDPCSLQSYWNFFQISSAI